MCESLLILRLGNGPPILHFFYWASGQAVYVALGTSLLSIRTALKTPTNLPSEGNSMQKTRLRYMNLAACAWTIMQNSATQNTSIKPRQAVLWGVRIATKETTKTSRIPSQLVRSRMRTHNRKTAQAMGQHPPTSTLIGHEALPLGPSCWPTGARWRCIAQTVIFHHVEQECQHAQAHLLPRAHHAVHHPEQKSRENDGGTQDLLRDRPREPQSTRQAWLADPFGNPAEQGALPMPSLRCSKNTRSPNFSDSGKNPAADAKDHKHH